MQLNEGGNCVPGSVCARVRVCARAHRVPKVNVCGRFKFAVGRIFASRLRWIRFGEATLSA